MTRGIGGVEFAGSLPDAVVAGGLLTQLGDMWFLLLAIGALYCRARGGAAPGLTPMPFRDCLLLLALAVGSSAAAAALKSAFALPRPARGRPSCPRGSRRQRRRSTRRW